MIIRDPIYGRFETPSFLDGLILAPEVRRLMDVRLLNTPSPSLPTLSEIRRFSHTLGVLRLALINPHIGLDREEVRALAAAILIHDAATAPLAHLLEYYLKDRSAWTHEAALPQMLTGHHSLENISDQILPGEEMKFKQVCTSSDIDFDVVLKIVRKQHPASGLIFGALDFDNLDNVLRMAWALGVTTNKNAFLEVARELAVTMHGEPVLSMGLKNAVEEWATVRNAVYQILVFDELTVASQAVLTKAIRVLFDAKEISDIAWARRDRDLLEALTRAPETKEMMLRNFHAALPIQLLSAQLTGTLSDLGFSSRDHAIDLIESVAREEFGIKRPFGYAFVDKAAFSKHLDFLDPSSRLRWSSGVSSSSVVLYCFVDQRTRPSAKMRKAFYDVVLRAVSSLAGRDVDEARISARLIG